MIDSVKRYGSLLFLFVSFLFEEICFRFFSGISLLDVSLIPLILISAVLALILFLILQIFPGSFHRHIIRIVLLAFAVFYSMQYCLHRMFGIYFEWKLLAGVSQVTGFTTETLHLVYDNIVTVLCLFIPFFVSLFLGKKAQRAGWKGAFGTLLALILLAGSLGASLYFLTYDGEPLYKLPLSLNSTELTVRKLGVSGQFLADSYKTLTGYTPEEIVIEEPEPEPEPEDVPVVYGYNELDIDFISLMNNDTDDTLKQMDEAFASQLGTRQNEYTGLFEGKNLIYIMAESFNEVAVSKDLTPTLYRMIHQGFDFTNYYSPTIYSTIGGECMELTGLDFTPTMLGIWKRGKNEFPMGLATVFKNEGYDAFAYHNSMYDFQERNVYLKTLGFDYFFAEGTGLEQRMDCKWVASDTDMIDVTFDDYKDTDHFLIYYATVSGHGEYWPDHRQARKWYDLVSEYYGDTISSTAKSYVATQVELDRAMELLLKKLDESGLSDDTVIVLAADHHPYFLDIRYINELSEYERDEETSNQHSNLIIYNPSVEHTVIDKVCGTPDVLPTVYNLFGISYESRLMTGKDIFSSEPGVVIFDNGSFVIGEGTWSAHYGKFFPNENAELSDEDLALWKTRVKNRLNTSTLIFEKNYYAHVFRR